MSPLLLCKPWKVRGLHIFIYNFIPLYPWCLSTVPGPENKCLLSWGKLSLLTYPPCLAPFSWPLQDDLMRPISPSVLMFQPLAAAPASAFPLLRPCPRAWRLCVSSVSSFPHHLFCFFPSILSSSCYFLLSFHMLPSHSSPLWGPPRAAPAHSWRRCLQQDFL